MPYFRQPRTNHIQNFTRKCKTLHVFWTQFKSKKIIKQCNFSIGFLNSKNPFFFSNYSKNARNVIQCHLNKLCYFSQKIAQWLEAWPPDPVYDTFELH